MSEQPHFKRLQYAFTAHIRNPAANPPPADIEARRMQVYNELLYNNVEGFIAGSFPVLRKITSDENWHRMVRDYFEHHHARTPLFPEMPREFLRYLEQERSPDEADYPFLLELAHYEWVELALSLAEEDPDPSPVDTEADLLTGQPVMSALAWPLTYRYPVHQIGPEFLPRKPGEQAACLVVYRDRDDEVRFLEVNAVTIRLLQLIQEAELGSGQQMLEAIATEIAHPEPQAVIEGGRQILEDLRLRGVILGVNPK